MHSFPIITQPELEAPHFYYPLAHIAFKVRVSSDALHDLVEALKAPAPEAPHGPQLEDVEGGMCDVMVLGLEEILELGHLCEANRGVDRGVDRGADHGADRGADRGGDRHRDRGGEVAKGK